MSDIPVLKRLDGLGFAEALRWHNGELWFSDMFRGRVMSWNPDADATVRLSHSQGGPEMPGGIGWAANGDLLVVDCLRRLVLRLDGSANLSVHADLSALTSYPLNDMHVEADGTAWVGGYGFNPDTEPAAESVLYRISPDGDVTLSSSKFVFPNGCERRADSFAVAETFADRISFIDDNGERVSSFDCEPGSGPDGLSFGPEAKLFVAMAFAGRIDSFTVDGEREVFFTLDASDNFAGQAMGIFDCAVRPDLKAIAFSSACLDEAFANLNDTGSITLLSLD